MRTPGNTAVWPASISSHCRAATEQLLRLGHAGVPALGADAGAPGGHATRICSHCDTGIERLSSGADPTSLHVDDFRHGIQQ